MLIFLLLQAAPLLLFLTLGVALYLTVIELRETEPRLHFLWWSWWLLLVFMTHFVGYLILRVYAFIRKRRTAAA